MKELTQEILKELLHYDPETGVFTWKIRDRKWFKSIRSHSRFNNIMAGSQAGNIHDSSKSGKRYIEIYVLGRTFKAHRLALIMSYGRVPDQVDHINGNGLDNRLLNLRYADKNINAKNKKNYSNSKSGVTGVCSHKTKSKCLMWRAYINIGGKPKHLGIFENINDAIEARKSAEIETDYHKNHGSKRPL